MHGGVYPQDKAYRRDKKLKWYACQQISLSCVHHYPAEYFINFYLLFAGISSISPGYSHNKMAAAIFMYIA